MWMPWLDGRLRGTQRRSLSTAWRAGMLSYWSLLMHRWSAVPPAPQHVAARIGPLGVNKLRPHPRDASHAIAYLFRLLALDRPLLLCQQSHKDPGMMQAHHGPAATEKRG